MQAKGRKRQQRSLSYVNRKCLALSHNDVRYSVMHIMPLPLQISVVSTGILLQLYFTSLFLKSNQPPFNHLSKHGFLLALLSYQRKCEIFSSLYHHQHLCRHCCRRIAAKLSNNYTQQFCFLYPNLHRLVVDMAGS